MVRVRGGGMTSSSFVPRRLSTSKTARSRRRRSTSGISSERPSRSPARLRRIITPRAQQAGRSTMQAEFNDVTVRGVLDGVTGSLGALSVDGVLTMGTSGQIKTSGGNYSIEMSSTLGLRLGQNSSSKRIDLSPPLIQVAD